MTGGNMTTGGSMGGTTGRLQAMVVRKVQIMEDGAKYNYNIARLFLLF